MGDALEGNQTGRLEVTNPSLAPQPGLLHAPRRLFETMDVSTGSRVRLSSAWPWLLLHSAFTEPNWLQQRPSGTHWASSIYTDKCQFPLSFHKQVVNTLASHVNRDSNHTGELRRRKY